MAELLSTMAEVTLGPSYQVIFEAIDPVTGAPVTGVVVSNIAIAAEDLTGIDESLVVQGIPLFTDISVG